ncbi:S41 family peptidase [Microscilla marina]|uniref:Peptidase, S41 family n=1 Tax=Microscilla marina ATCC 23134 TaxID=313606 RepID=A1ZR49_MICM2|nr:S41 family peptidase [Microscilla marina]EAY27138.1 peptidase, S41 family [Microscilla marina ATCC 23134]
MIRTKLSKVFVYRLFWAVIHINSCLLIAGFAPLWAQNEETYDVAHRYSVAELKEDFKLVRKVLQQAHPGVYWYTKPEIFKQKFDSTYLQLNQAMTEVEFYRFLSPLVALANCGHTVLDPSEEYQNQGKRFPLDIKFVDDKVYLLYNYSEDSTLQMGSELLEIEGQPIKKIVAKLLPAISSDAHNEIFKYGTLEEDFQNYYDLFIGKPDTFLLKCRSPQGKIFTTKVAASDDPMLKRYHKRSAIEVGTYPLRYKEIDSLSTAVMKITSFYPTEIKEGGQRFSRYLRRSFKKIHRHKIQNLVIDLRNNAGGEMLYANGLFAYLYGEPYMFLDRIEVATNKPLDFLKYTNWDKIDIHDTKYLEEQAQDSTIKKDGVNYVVKTNYYDFLEIQYPRRKRVFKGNVYVLMNRKSYSATCLFASLLYSTERATFIGEEAGGGAQGLNGGTFLDVTLPHTYLNLVVPLEKWVKIPQNYPHLNRGIIPHYVVQPSIMERVNKEDKVMEFTLQKIAKSPKK